MANIPRPPVDEAQIRACSPESALRGAPWTGAWVLVATILASSMAFIDGTITNVALPVLQEDLGASAAEALWVVEAYALFLAALILVGGSLGDHLGRQRVFLFGIVVFTVASVGCGLAQNPEGLIVARAVSGIGGALMVPGSLAIVGNYFSEEERGRAIGTWSGFSGITTALGPVVGGFLIENVSWRAAFFLNVPIALIVVLVALRYVPESFDPDARRLDLPGAALATLGLGGVVFALIEAPVRGASDGLVVVSGLVGVVSLAGFVFVEGRSAEPMMPLSLFRSRLFGGANLLTFLLYAGLGGALYFLPFNLIQVHGYSATAAGSAFLPFVVLTFLLSRWAGGLVPRIGPRPPLVVGPCVAALGFVLFALPGTGGSYWETFFPAIVVLGLGMSLVIAPLTTTALGAVDDAQAGLASGVNNAVSRIGGLLAVPVMGAVVLAAFSFGLEARLADLDLPPEARDQILADRNSLAGLTVPDGLSVEQAADVEGAVGESFVGGFRLVMLLAAGLALASALAAATILPSSRKGSPPGPSP